jgi:methyl-accepting chemotaxis protein
MSPNNASMFNFNNLKLGQKLTLVLLIIFLAGSVVSGIALSRLLNYSAQREIVSQALILMQTMNSVRDYTSTQVKPELADKLETEFLPETVPAYSATEVFDRFRKDKDFSQFFYKEATLNPTNPRDKADPFETKIVKKFQSSNNLQETEGFRTINGIQVFYTASPLAVSQESCLECHSTPDVAPVSMIKRYGTEGGFGWKLNEIVGAQVVFVPASKVLESARQSFILTMSIVVGVFALAILLVNFWLRKAVVRPITRMAEVAEVVSQGNLDAEFQKFSDDEVGKLSDAFSRMRTSFVLAMKKLDQEKRKNRASQE